jgi:hypothetical protein
MIGLVSLPGRDTPSIDSIQMKGPAFQSISFFGAVNSIDVANLVTGYDSPWDALDAFDASIDRSTTDDDQLFMSQSLLYSLDPDSFMATIDANRDALLSHSTRITIAILGVHQEFLSIVDSIPTIRDIYNNSNHRSLHTYNTIPSLAYGLSMAYIKQKKIKLPTLSYSQYTMIKKHGVGGMLMVHPTTIVTEEVVSLDIVSAYGSSMIVYDEHFFCGTIKEVVMTPEEIEDSNVDLQFGYYCVDIDQSNLVASSKPLIRCKKTEDGNSYEYDAESIIQKSIILNSSDITFMRSNGCIVDIVPESINIRFSEGIKNARLFEWLLPIMRSKNNEDENKNNGLPYSKGHRTVYKMILNNLSGKFYQNLYPTSTKAISRHLFESGGFLPKDLKAGTFVGWLSDIGRDKCLISYTRDLSIAARIPPIYIGDLIYSFTRQHLYKSILSHLDSDDVLYVDTDCVKMKRSILDSKLNHLKTAVVPCNQICRDFDTRYNNHPMLCSSTTRIFGGFVNEFDTNNNVTIIIGKKQWASFHVNENNDIQWHKAALSGISRSSILLTGDEPFIGITRDDQLYVRDKQECLKYIVSTSTDHQLSDPKNIFKLFMKKASGVDVHLLCNHIYRKDLESKFIFIIKKF